MPGSLWQLISPPVYFPAIQLIQRVDFLVNSKASKIAQSTKKKESTSLPLLQIQFAVHIQMTHSELLKPWHTHAQGLTQTNGETCMHQSVVTYVEFASLSTGSLFSKPSSSPLLLNVLSACYVNFLSTVPHWQALLSLLPALSLCLQCSPTPTLRQQLEKTWIWTNTGMD